MEYYLPTGPEVVQVLGHSWFDHTSGLRKDGAVSRNIVDTRSETLEWGTIATPGQIRIDDITRDDVAFGWCAACRQGDRLSVFPSPTMGDRSLSWSLGYGTSVRLFDAAGTAIPGSGIFTLPPESGRYRLEQVQTDQVPGSLYGREIRTVWDFTATARPTVNEVELPYDKPRPLDPAPAAWQPVIFLNYEVPVELDNTAPAGRPVWIDVHAAAGKPGSGADIAGLELQASFDDGQSWADALVVRRLGDGRFRVLVTHPTLSQTTGAVTLRAHAWDAAGNKVTQTVDRAYGLR